MTERPMHAPHAQDEADDEREHHGASTRGSANEGNPEGNGNEEDTGKNKDDTESKDRSSGQPHGRKPLYIIAAGVLLLIAAAGIWAFATRNQVTTDDRNSSRRRHRSTRRRLT
jgi:membrane fusion protein (multidrug efflux system)